MTAPELFEELVPALIVGLYAAPLVVAVGTDVLWFRIPNLLVAVSIAGFFGAALLTPVPLDWAMHLGVAAAALAGGMALFALGWMGAGDVKLGVAVMLWCGAAAPVFLVAMGLAGGAVALALFATRRALRRLIPLVSGTTPALPDVLLPGAPVPYGTAIAAGGLLTVTRLPVLG